LAKICAKNAVNFGAGTRDLACIQGKLNIGLAQQPDQERPQQMTDEPILTLPADEARLLQDHYARADVVLEYGSGGSTLLAARLGKQVFSVESDAAWAQSLSGHIAQNGFQSLVRLIHVDVGPVGKWGKPTDKQAFGAWHCYPLKVWDRDDFQHPDVILVDGRLRAACLVTAILRAQKPVTVLFDDYANRAQYHVVERILKPTEIVGRMARFDVTPNMDVAQHLTWMIGTFTQMQLATLPIWDLRRYLRR
jgi:hypothetical protein